MSSLRKLKSGSWQVAIRKKDQPVIYKTYKEKGLASKFGKDVEARMERNIFEDYSGASATTLKDLICKYRDEIVPEQKAHRQTTCKLNLLTRQKIAYLNLMQIKASHIYELKKTLSEGRKAKTVNIYIQLLAMIWKTAKRNFNISLPAESPFSLVALPKIDDTRTRVLSGTERDKLLKAASESKLLQLHDFIQFALMTGARYGEIVRLRREDTDYNKKTCTFRNTKNGFDREIPLADAVITILKRYPFGDTFFRIKEDSFRFYWNQARAKADLKDFRFHDCRATFCTLALLNGMSESSVALISGHRDFRQLRKYLRIKPADLLDSVNKIVSIK